ncbi:hypothetical protein [Paraburkholderia sp.]|uniref:hypothetical protein n=1 Tax=Paraburkholderia sp. TaxID=1926495 RepID=UPI0039E49B30
MYEPAASTTVQASFALARVSAAADAISSAIAGFALLAGARAFMFIALLGWREPVLGGAGLMLLALLGWLRWRCGKESRTAAGLSSARFSAQSCAQPGRSATARAGGAHETPMASARPHARLGQVRNVACYNRPIIAVRRNGPVSSVDARLDALYTCERVAIQLTSRDPHRTAGLRPPHPHHKETPC